MDFKGYNLTTRIPAKNNKPDCIEEIRNRHCFNGCLNRFDIQGVSDQ